MTYHNPMNQYRTVDAYGAAAAGDRVQLIARLMQGATEIKCSEFGQNIIAHM